MIDFSSTNPAKAWTEKVMLAWAFCGWIPMMVVIVATGIYEDFTALSYFIVGCIVAVPCWILPLVVPGNVCDSRY